MPKDNFTVEVPEAAVAQYQTAVGWNEFKRIAAHHELVCRPSIACALATEHKQSLIVDAEGEWEVASKPDWCEVSPASGNKKTEVTLTINAMAKNGTSICVTPPYSVVLGTMMMSVWFRLALVTVGALRA